MLLAVDVGNTNISFGLFEGTRLVHHLRSESARSRTPDEFAMMVHQMMVMRGVDRKSIHHAVLASVVPPLTDTIEDMVVTAFGCKPLVVGPGVKTGMKVLYESPREVGADCVVNAVASARRVGRWRVCR